MREKRYLCHLLRLLPLGLALIFFSTVLSASDQSPAEASVAATQVQAAGSGVTHSANSVEAAAIAKSPVLASAVEALTDGVVTEHAASRSTSVDDQVADSADKDLGNVLDYSAMKIDSLVGDFVINGANEYLPEDVLQVMRKEFMGNTLWQFTCSFLLLLVTLLLRNIVTRVFFVYITKLVGRTRFDFDSKLLAAMHKPLSVFLLFFGIFVALMVLSMSEPMRQFIENLYRGLVVVIIIWALLRAVDVMVDLLLARNAARYKAMHGFAPLIRKTLKIFIGVIGVVMVIDNLGFNVGGILATLGIGGAALAFASKDTIANGFGTLMIMLDRPFKVGDWITVGDKVDGDVEEIGLRSTKVRTWPKTVLSIPNGVLANEYINNWSRMPKRRVRQVINIAHGATANDMQGLVEDIRALLRGDEGVEQEFMLVTFTDITSDSLEVLVYYFTISIKWLEHMEVRQRVNLKMMQAIEERGLKIAFLEQSMELEYNKDIPQSQQLPWDERWQSEIESNPKGTYTRRGGSANASANSGDKPQLPGDFGPKMPL